MRREVSENFTLGAILAQHIFRNSLFICRFLLYGTKIALLTP